MVVVLEFTIIIDKKFSFANAPNGKITLQTEMQNQKIIWSLKIFVINGIQIITFHKSKIGKCHIGLHYQYLWY